jgi:hypothetical protein|eukprot:COSAG01_NODE_1211_length_11216_cov_47.562562_7_plen_149_part_00
MYEWILAIRRELAATELEALPSEIPEASTCPVSKSAVTFYSQEHNELLCDECVGKGRTPKGFAVIRDELLSLQAAEAEGIGRLETVIDSSYGLRDILVRSALARRLHAFTLTDRQLPRAGSDRAVDARLGPGIQEQTYCDAPQTGGGV